uniref:SMP-30/Gluconolactonase/LRE-like region domain-containing protein n=1 Tax=Branchiostoma floridae TaxID=7739 RepID=C3Z145_BRAFL|eukprot:XP_002597732.1 hypothetical protein BRAFLDRAFT_77364 [Branchiostoma floridae]
MLRITNDRIHKTTRNLARQANNQHRIKTLANPTLQSADNPCLQPYANTELKEDDINTNTASSHGDACLQPCTEVAQKDDGYDEDDATLRQYEAPPYEEDDDDIGPVVSSESNTATKNGHTADIDYDSADCEPYAVTYTLKPVSNSSPGTTLPVMSKSPPENYGKHVKPEKIIFGKKGSGPGEFDVTRDAVVSADNEIFVVDGGHRRVQVFSLNGTFLRFFPTTVPGEDGREMFPTDVDIDKEGHLWVTGTKKLWSDGGGGVVKYRKDGKPLSKFHIHCMKKQISTSSQHCA